MKTRFLTASVFLLLSAQFIFGQTTHTPLTPAQIVANRVARLTGLLTLTTAQQGEATTIFTTEQSALSGLGASMKTARTGLLTAVESNDTAGISMQASQIGGLTTQEVQATSTANASFYAMLTSAQQTKYKQLGGPGGFGGGRGGFGLRGRRN